MEKFNGCTEEDISQVLGRVYTKSWGPGTCKDE
jgi:hypothetical protein